MVRTHWRRPRCSLVGHADVGRSPGGGLRTWVQVGILCLTGCGTPQAGPPSEEIALSEDAEVLAHGEHLVRDVLGCVQCHGEDLGGQLIPGRWWGETVAPNLTTGEGGVGARYGPMDWGRMLRHGLDPNGERLQYMPIDRWQGLSDGDLHAVVSWLLRVPPVHRSLGTAWQGWSWDVAEDGGVTPMCHEANKTTEPTSRRWRVVDCHGNPDVSVQTSRVDGCRGGRAPSLHEPSAHGERTALSCSAR